jgi:MoaA/NifB/PqqE/SkfB family radical SAM enzyme
MRNYMPNSPTLEEWKRGFDNLKSLGCQFAAFYGAEPLIEFEKLPETIEYAEKLGIRTTVITSGVVKDVNQKLLMLYNHGLRSLTTSYDYVPNDFSSNIKTNKALQLLEAFRNFGKVRDLAVVVTLTKKNLDYLPEIILEMTFRGIWTFFDIIHPDRGQPGSKVKNSDLDLLLTKKDYPRLMKILDQVMILKKNGCLVHTSTNFHALIQMITLFENDLFKWNCAKSAAFPSWVTVDADGRVLPCDDFDTKAVHIKVWELNHFWVEFGRKWVYEVLFKCPGCCWNTHYDSHEIKLGRLPITDYIHGMEGGI